MVEGTASWLLRHTDVDPLNVAKVFNYTETECWDYLMAYNKALDDAVASYDPLKVQAEVREWIKEIPDAKNIRINAIKEQLLDAKDNPEKHNVESLLLEVKILKGTAERPTPEIIRRAKEYPLERLLNTQGKKGNISCPFHKDRTPSFQIRKDNTFTCYSCNEHGDSIDLYQKLHKVSFIEAVRKLI